MISGTCQTVEQLNIVKVNNSRNFSFTALPPIEYRWISTGSDTVTTVSGRSWPPTSDLTTFSFGVSNLLHSGQHGTGWNTMGDNWGTMSSRAAGLPHLLAVLGSFPQLVDFRLAFTERMTHCFHHLHGIQGPNPKGLAQNLELCEENATHGVPLVQCIFRKQATVEPVCSGRTIICGWMHWCKLKFWTCTEPQSLQHLFWLA